MSYNEFRDDVLLALDTTPDSVLRRVKTFDKGVVLQVALPNPSRAGRSSTWEGVKIIHPFDEAWIDQLLSHNLVTEETVAGEQVYVLVQHPPLVEDIPPTPALDTTGIGGEGSESVVPNGDAVPPTPDALTPMPNAEYLAHGDWPAGEAGTDGDIKEDAANDLGEPKPAESVEDEQPKAAAEPSANGEAADGVIKQDTPADLGETKPAEPPTKASVEPKSGKTKNK